MSRKSSSCASGWSKSNICAPPSPISNGRSLDNWSATPYSTSSPRSSCPTVVFGFRKTCVAVAPMWAYAWVNKDWPRPGWSGDQEHKTLVGLTNLITKNRPMLPKLNPQRALFVLSKIDEILAWEQRKEAEKETRFVELGRYLCEVRAGQYWRLENLHSFDEFLARRFPESRRTAYYLMSIHEHLPPQIRRELKQVGWTKAAELTKVARSDGKDFDCAAWMHKARSLPRDQFKREVDRHLTGKDTEPTEIVYFK